MEHGSWRWCLQFCSLATPRCWSPLPVQWGSCCYYQWHTQRRSLQLRQLWEWTCWKIWTTFELLWCLSLNFATRQQDNLSRKGPNDGFLPEQFQWQIFPSNSLHVFIIIFDQRKKKWIQQQQNKTLSKCAQLFGYHSHMCGEKQTAEMIGKIASCYQLSFTSHPTFCENGLKVLILRQIFTITYIRSSPLLLLLLYYFLLLLY